MIRPAITSSLLTDHFAWCARHIPLDRHTLVLLQQPPLCIDRFKTTHKAIHFGNMRPLEVPLQLVSSCGAAGGASPPVCRLLNFSQVSFEAKVKERKLEKLKHENRRTALIKEVSCLHALFLAGRQDGQFYIAHHMHAGCFM